MRRAKFSPMGKELKSYWSQLIWLIFLLSINFNLVIPIYGKEPDWLIKLRRLEIFISTKSDVEILFNNPKITDIYNYAEKEKNGWSKKVEYETKDGELTVLYSTGKCAEVKSPIGYDIDKDVVAELKFSPRKPLSLKKLRYDLSKFEYISTIDIQNTYILSNDEIGIEFFIGNEKVESVKFETRKEHEKLNCKNILPK